MTSPTRITPDAALDVIERVAETLPGFRRAHARGIGVRATFRGSADAPGLTSAEHFQGAPIPCVVRFSNAAADPRAADLLSPGHGAVLGLAIQFALPSGAVAAWAGINLRTFLARTPDEFIALTKVQTRPLRFAWHVLTHPHSLLGILALARLKPAPSFASETYFGLHTYVFVDASGNQQPFRYSWVPRVKLPALGHDAARRQLPHFLLDEMRTRVGAGEIVYDLVAQLPESSDELLAANVAWPQTRRQIPLGTLTLERVHEDQTLVEAMVFDPGAVVPGIEASEDPILRFRSRIYAASHERRSAEARSDKAPSDIDSQRRPCAEMERPPAQTRVGLG